VEKPVQTPGQILTGEPAPVHSDELRAQGHLAGKLSVLLELALMQPVAGLLLRVPYRRVQRPDPSSQATGIRAHSLASNPTALRAKAENRTIE
jgi:hypothetical protein